MTVPPAADESSDGGGLGWAHTSSSSAADRPVSEPGVSYDR